MPLDHLFFPFLHYLAVQGLAVDTKGYIPSVRSEAEIGIAVLEPALVTHQGFLSLKERF